MRKWMQQWLRVLLTLLPLLVALLHASGILRWDLVDRLDHIIYDTRLRALMPGTLDERIVVVDVDEKSLAEVGRWPWGRDRLASLVDQLFDRQHIALLGIDFVFAEADDSSGLAVLQRLADSSLKDDPRFLTRLDTLRAELDFDARLTRALQGREVVLGFYFTSDAEGRASGQLPAPLLNEQAFQGRQVAVTQWRGYGANLPQLAHAAPQAGFFNAITTERDGVVRSVPLLGRLAGQYYASLSLAMFRALAGHPAVVPVFPQGPGVVEGYDKLSSLRLALKGREMDIPVTEPLAALVPYRGPGGAAGGSFRYISASDVLAGRLPPDQLRGKIVLLGTTAPGLLDMRVTPVGEAYPGVEVHANVISALLDGRMLSRPDYTLGFEIVVLLVSGILLAVALPRLTAFPALLLSLAVGGGLIGLNFALYLGEGLVLPLALSLLVVAAAFAVNMSYGYFVESRSKRDLAQLFGSYVAPELVAEMVRDPGRYSMRAHNKQMTVLFCDMRGFTKLSETMEPIALQRFLNSVFSSLTQVIKRHRGTIDKYMGDCVMAFWGAPVDQPDHAELAVQAALDMVQAIAQLNAQHRASGLPEIGIGIGLNSGWMCVGDMGSETRRSYTVIGDAVNLASRLEALSKLYGVAVVVSDSTRSLAPGFVWQGLDRVRVQGKQQAVDIHTPLARADDAAKGLDQDELAAWAQALAAYRAQDWNACENQLLKIHSSRPEKSLYHLYLDRVAAMRQSPPAGDWDGSTSFDRK